jgi:hypothetical protein
MTTSNQTIFELNRDQIISAALRKLLVLGDDQVATATQLANGTQALNAIVATFQSLGMPLWKRTELPITMVAGQRDYTIGMGRTIAVPFPLHVHEAALNLPGSGSPIDVTVKPRADFNMLPSTSNGIPVNATYQPFTNYGVFSVWPTPDSTTATGTTITITYQAPFQYFIGSTDTPDFPQEWANALIYALAVSLAPENGVPLMDRTQLIKEADRHLMVVLANGGEDGSIYFGVGG